MSVPQIRLKVDGFRAVAKANIVIDGITVVAGENGSGKSTVSKLLYYLFKTACNYDVLVDNELRRNLKDILVSLEIALSDMNVIQQPWQSNDAVRQLYDLVVQKHVSEEQMESWSDLIAQVQQAYKTVIDENDKRHIGRKRRLVYILKNVLGEDNKDDPNVETENVPALLAKMDDLIKSHFRIALSKIKTRPASLFGDALSVVFPEGIIPGHLEVQEYDEPIYSKDKDSLSIPFSIQNVIYTDTPMVIGKDGTEVDYWNDLNELLRKKKSRTPFSNLSQMISRDVIKGDVSIDESPSGRAFLYKRADGMIFDLQDCATGIKSFAILQLLLNNGELNDKTLLIIDEPEVHLHPQWIVEYARIIVMLNKHLGVKFFIASHDPDFVGAIRYISEKEGNLDKVNYYLADRSTTDYMYNYQYLGVDIDPIFKSFNRALERIDLYGA